MYLLEVLEPSWVPRIILAMFLEGLLERNFLLLLVLPLWLVPFIRFSFSLTLLDTVFFRGALRSTEPFLLGTFMLRTEEFFLGNLCRFDFALDSLDSSLMMFLLFFLSFMKLLEILWLLVFVLVKEKSPTRLFFCLRD